MRERTFVTQAEHPILGVPFFTIHPCQTANIMALFRPGTIFFYLSVTSYIVEDPAVSSTANYLLSWLSVVGPVIGLELPLRYFVR